MCECTVFNHDRVMYESISDLFLDIYIHFHSQNKARYIVTDEVHKRMFKEMEIHFRSLVSHLRNTVSITVRCLEHLFEKYKF